MTAAYRVLARKYRPSTFSELIGQEVLVRTLSNAIATNRVAHAFLLTGIRGIGKTTTARIIARALNCIGEDGQGGPTIAPCGVCSQCTSIAADRNVDVLEMDAASRTGVDDIRDIIDTVMYAPSSARYKIYIIDEVHMLSKNAFNALLKTLEEPPAHVKFIFATTEIRKIPVTILSRCQRFDLKRVEVETLARHLRDICGKEHVQADDEALQLIATAAEGSVRDSLSLLDQAIAHGSQENGTLAIETEIVRDMLGLVDRSQSFTLLEHLAAGEISAALLLYRQLHHAGADALQLLGDVSELVHLMTQIKIDPSLASDPTFSQTERERASALAAQLSIPALSRLWMMLQKGLQDIQSAPNPQAAAEMVLIRITYSSTLPTPDQLLSGSAPSILMPPTPPSGGSRLTAPVASAVRAPATAVSQSAMPQMIPSADTTVQVNSFEHAIALFNERKEPILYHHLMRDAKLIQFAQGRIELALSPNAPADLPGKVGKYLSDWTGQRWVVMLSKAAPDHALSLHDQQQQMKQNAMQSASAHPLVQAAILAFPGAELVDVELPPQT